MSAPQQTGINASNVDTGDRILDYKESKEPEYKGKFVEASIKPSHVTEYEEYMSSVDEQKEQSYTESGVVDYSYFKRVIEATKAVDMNITKGAVYIDPNGQKQVETIEEEQPEDVNNEVKEKETDAWFKEDKRTMGDEQSEHNTELNKSPKEITTETASNEEMMGNVELTEDHSHGEVLEQTASPTDAIISSLTVKEAENIIVEPKMRRGIPGLKNIKPKYPTKSYTLTPYINE